MHIKGQVEEVLAKHKHLVYNSKSNSLSGELYLPDGDNYELLINIDQYPKFFPSVYETGGRIPRKVSRHIYSDTGSCCFTTKGMSQILLRTKITTLLKFIDEIVVKYLENNSYFEINKQYFTDEYPHDKSAIIEAYQDILGINNKVLITDLIIQRLRNRKLTIRDYCYCKSGVVLKKCSNGRHNVNHRNFRLIDKEILLEDLKIIFSLMN